MDTEKVYEIFISFKNKDASGKPTTDSEVAEKIYRYLKDRGVVTFFSEEEIYNSSYSDSIYDALEQAKVLLIVGSREEYIESKWLKDEYTKFFELSDIPNVFCIQLKPFILPKRLRGYQALDYNQPDFWNKLERSLMDHNISFKEVKKEKKESKEQLLIKELFNKYDKSSIVLNKRNNKKVKNEILKTIEEVIEIKERLLLFYDIIIDDLKYASRVQTQLMPSSQDLKNVFKENEHFIFNKPKLIIGGDFYWVKENCGKVIIVVADCVGSSIPGAIVSTLIIPKLNKIVDGTTPIHSNQILDELHRVVASYNKESIIAGADVSIYIYNKINLEIEYSGAYLPLVIIRNNELIEYKADKQPIGFHVNPDINGFDCKLIKLQKGDMVYSYTDGYYDQFGGPKGKKYTRKMFHLLLCQISQLDIKEQCIVLDNTLRDWKGEIGQVDDILIFGLRI